MYMIYCDMFPARLLKDLYVPVVSNSAPEGTDHWQLLEAVGGGGGGSSVVTHQKIYTRF